jgi:nucleoside-diphosphate-sugar epimerase
MFKGRMLITVRGAFDWVDVRDVAAALIAAAERGRTGENYLVGGYWPPFAELGRVAADVAGRRPPRLLAPLAPLQLAAGVAVRVVGPRRAGRLLLTPESLHAFATDPVVDCSKAAGSATGPARWPRRWPISMRRSSPTAGCRRRAESGYPVASRRAGCPDN